MLQPILTTGLSGLIGSKLASDFAEKYDFQNLDINHPTHPTDITKLADVQRTFAASPAEFVVHFAAFTDVTAAWQQTGDTSGPAYQVNVVGTENIVRAAAETGKHVIHISTAFVFDGEKTEPYLETDPTHPIEWYGETKVLAEQAVQATTAPWSILRIDFPFRSDPFPRPDIVRKTVANLQKGYPLFTDHHFGPTYIDDFVKVIDWVIRTRATGLYHASSGESWTDYDLGKLLNEHFQLGLEVKAGSLAEYLKTSNRPYQKNTALNCEKLKKSLDFELVPIHIAIERTT